MSIKLDTTFAVETVDRAVKTFAQAVIVSVGLSDSGPVNAFELDWKLALGFGAGGAILSVLTSFASGSIFKHGNTPASALPPPAPPAV